MSILSPQHKRRMDEILRKTDNKVCFDCHSPQPRWATSTFGVFLCMRCAGVHRSLGVHISKVQSVNMDSWEESLLRRMELIGNSNGKKLYEHTMPESFRPHSNTPAPSVAKLLRDKYEHKMFFHPNYEALLEQVMTQPHLAQAKKGVPTPPPPSPPSEPMEELWGEPVVAVLAPPAPQVSAIAALFAPPTVAEASVGRSPQTGGPSSPVYPPAAYPSPGYHPQGYPVGPGPMPSQGYSLPPGYAHGPQEYAVPQGPYPHSPQHSGVAPEQEILSLFSAVPQQKPVPPPHVGPPFAW